MDALTVAVSANLPVILWGAPGTGKTSAVLALGARLGLPVEVVVGSIREPSDFAGLPVVREGGTWFAPPRWAERLAAAGSGILFLDELTTAPPAVQAAMLRVVLERAVGDLVLPPSVRIVAAANPPAQAADGWELSAPLANRLIHLDWTISAASVAEGFTSGFPGPDPAWAPPPGDAAVARARALVGAFLRVRPELVLSVPDGPARAWPSPRTWELAATAVACTSVPRSARKAPGTSGDPATSGTVGDGGGGFEVRDADVERVRAELVVGAVGEAAGFELLSWLRDLDLPDPETLLTDPAAPLPDRIDRVHAVLGSVVAHVTADGGADSWQRAWTLIGRVAKCAPDVAASAARLLATRRPKGATLPATVLELAPILRSAGLMP
ncbi:AAA family ATPase [Nonomuraea jiangxiensis]|uniref:AAA domain (Dynein-related subfamily) n=1 Tax=Nonomuraea jiangxiensis TaxID=633440 RepID=A0A1G8RP84_9ACTN|nr:AAA family ATPase [Nonomuraea jiangxiensis]SDJ18305.1 AAA domain (dynein-related subfamily) [Nonomuraea jiangxiensis]